jgi:hypothetical protein
MGAEMSPTDIVLITTILFSDGTPSEVRVYPQPSIEICINQVQDVLINTKPPVRKHRIEGYSATCLVGAEVKK